MSIRNFRSFLWLGALAATASVGCASNRPSRNGVFNENQFVRKDFLVRSGDGSTPDTGWVLKASIVNATTPNPLGSTVFGLFPGSENGAFGAGLVRFRVTQDHLEIINLRETSDTSTPGTAGSPATPDSTKQQEVTNSWPITNVDLKYRVNLDGEVTNFYEENQEANWEDRQWVKINFAKNDASDLAPFGQGTTELVSACTDVGNATVSLEPETFVVDEANDYMGWTVQVNLPLRFDSTECLEAYGSRGATALKIGRQNVTFDLKYSLVRSKAMPKDPANPSAAANEVTYKPLEIPEKDAIRHKYGVQDFISEARDPSTGMLAARQFVIRWDPTKKVTWWFDKSFPEKYKHVFTDQPGPASPFGGVAFQTNALLQKTGSTMTVEFKDAANAADVQALGGAIPTIGDVRYNMIYWLSDEDIQDDFAGVTQYVPDPRTGELLGSSIGFNDFAIKDLYVQRIDSYLASIGECAKWDPGDATHAPSCKADVNSPDQVGGAQWPATPYGFSGACDPGNPAAGKPADTVPLVPSYAKKYHNGTSPLSTKIQTYLHKDPGTVNPSTGAPYGYLDVTDLAVNADNDTEFQQAYFHILPYYVFADPDTNQFVTPEGQQGVYGPGSMMQLLKTESDFHTAMGSVDRGETPFDADDDVGGFQSALAFSKQLGAWTQNHRALNLAKNFVRQGQHLDSPSAFSFEQMISRDARRCINDASGSNPHWESRDEWVNNLIDTYWSQVIWHEFGHAMGLDHNFMASVDKPNFPTPQKYSWNEPSFDDNGNPLDSEGNIVSSDSGKKQAIVTHTSERYPLYSSSVMEYNGAPDRISWTPAWGQYDQGAMAFIYSNDTASWQAAQAASNKPTLGKGQVQTITGQVTSAYPWKDPLGFDSKNEERVFLFCAAQHMKYSPFCRQGDMGTTPSEIIANQIENYDWQYQWRNYRAYHKIWDDSAYADGPTALIDDLRRFMPMWTVDMDAADVIAQIRRTGAITPPSGVSSQNYYNQLAVRFNTHFSVANQIVAAFHKAVMQMTAGERPYKTLYDPYFGDVDQQGITVDKLVALNAFTTLWPADNYDRNEVAGVYFASFSLPGGDGAYQTVAEDAVESMVGGQYNDVFPYFKPLAVAQFAQATHDINYNGRIEARDWIGGYTFDREQDFLDFFRAQAVKNHMEECDVHSAPEQFPTADNPTGTPAVQGTDTLDTCTYDPRQAIPDAHHADSFNEFIGPDHRRWAYAYIQDRNQWVVVDRDRNTASYVIVRQYNADIVNAQNDGSASSDFGGPYNELLPLKYFLDSFKYYN